MTRRKTQSVLLILLISSLITGFVAEFLYHRDFDNITSFEKFSLTLHNQIEKSELILKPFVDNFESIHEDIFFENVS